MPRSSAKTAKPERFASDNPFTKPRETRSITLTFRVTPTEHAAMVKAAGTTQRSGLVDLIREGLGLIIERRTKGGPR